MIQLEVDSYLKRIGFEGTPKIDIDTLARLQYQHLHTVPYENIDILNKKRISMEISDIYKKIVIQNRGGYCFELNGLFGWLLSEIGFDVTHLMGRFLRGESSIPMRRHRVLKIKLNDKEYLCDVGVGGLVPFKPIEMKAGIENKMRDENYKLSKDSFLGWVLNEMHEGIWRNLYSFTEEPQLDIDFVMPSFYCEFSDDSIFNKTTMAAIRTEDGRYSIADKEFKIFTGSEVKTFTLSTDYEYNECLEKYFKIIVK